MIISRWILLRKKIASKFVQKIKTPVLCSVSVFKKWCRLRDNVGKHGRARRATDEVYYGACALHAGQLSQKYTHRFIIFTTNWFSTAKMVKRTRYILRYTCIACLLINRLQTVSHSNPGTDKDYTEWQGVSRVFLFLQAKVRAGVQTQLREFSHISSHKSFPTSSPSFLYFLRR